MITLFFSYTDAIYAQTQTQYALQKCLCDTLYMQHVLPLKTQGWPPMALTAVLKKSKTANCV